MAKCFLCGKKKVTGRISRHKRGVAGAQWAKRAQKKSRVFKPNLHKYPGLMLCTKCLRKYKKEKAQKTPLTQKISHESPASQGVPLRS